MDPSQLCLHHFTTALSQHTDSYINGTPHQLLNVEGLCDVLSLQCDLSFTVLNQHSLKGAWKTLLLTLMYNPKYHVGCPVHLLTKQIPSFDGDSELLTVHVEEGALRYQFHLKTRKHIFFDLKVSREALLWVAVELGHHFPDSRTDNFANLVISRVDS